MAKKKGICRNEECEMYGQEFVQEADEFNFVCEKCQEPLFELPKKKSWWDLHKKQVMIGAAVVVAIAIITILCLNMCSGSKTNVRQDNGVDTTKIQSSAPVEVKASVSIVPPASTTLKVGENVTLSAKITPDDNSVSWASSDERIASVSPDGKVTALKAGNADIIAQNGEAKDTIRFEVKKVETAPGEKGPINLGYGTYVGDLKNGKPHGFGTITYTRSHQIVSSQKFIANPGDKFEGEFRDGRISGGIGYWHHDGDITAIKP